MNLENSPLKKMKHGEINKPTISKPFNNTSDNIKIDSQYKEPTPQLTQTQTPNEPRANQENISTAEPKKKTQEKNILHTFYINKDLLFTLQAIALYDNKPINNILNKALADYLFNTYDTDIINKARELYKQIKKIKGD